MLYTGFNSLLSRQVGTYATSTDLINWKVSEIPLYWKTETWEQIAAYGPNEPTVLLEKGQFKIWYRATPNNSGYEDDIGYLTIPQDPTSKEPVL